MVRWHLKTWITDYKRVQENFHSLKKKKKKDTKLVYMQTEFQYKHYMGFQDKRKREISSNSLQSMTKLLSLQSESSYAYKTWI